MTRLLERRAGLKDSHRRAVVIAISVLVAFLLWFSFSLREQYSVVIEMPIEIGQVPEGMALASRPPSMARVTVTGVGAELLRLQQNPPPLILRADSDQIDVTAAVLESPRLPAGLSVQSVSPSSIQLQLEPVLSRTVPIRLDATVETASAYDLTATPRLRPDTIVVTGARSLVAPLDHLQTEHLQVRGLRQATTVNVAVRDTFPGLLRLSTRTIDVEFAVEPFTEATREMDVRVEAAPPGATPVVLVPSRVRVVYRVPVAQYEASLDSPDLFPYVSYTAVMEDTTGAVRPVLSLPADLTIRDERIEPRRLRYRVRIE